MARLVAPAFRPGPQVTRQQIRRIGFHHQPIRGDPRYQFPQVQPASFVTNPSGDTNMQIKFQVRIECRITAGEAMYDHLAEMGPMFAQDRMKSFKSITFVQKQRLAKLRRQLQMSDENLFLITAR